MISVFSIAAGIVVVICFVWVTGSICSSRLRYRHRLNEKGTTLEHIMASPDRGVLVYDPAYGRSVGLGAPIVWWLESVREEVTSEDLASAHLVRLPVVIGSLEDLRRVSGELPIRTRITFVDKLYA